MVYGEAHSPFLDQPELASLVGKDKGHDTKTSGLFHVLTEWLLVFTVTSDWVKELLNHFLSPLQMILKTTLYHRVFCFLHLDSLATFGQTLEMNRLSRKREREKSGEARGLNEVFVG